MFHVITNASFSVLKFLNHYLLRKLKKKISPFDKGNKHLFRKRYVLPNKANVMVVTNKLMQGFGTSGSINDYRTKLLSGHFGNLFETVSLVIQTILSLLLVIFTQRSIQSLVNSIYVLLKANSFFKIIQYPQKPLHLGDNQ